MMKKQMGKVIGGLLVAGLMVTGVTTGLTTAYAANTTAGAAGVAVDTKYSLEKMLTYAIEDEYLAQTEYKVIMDTFDVQKPYSNIIKAEATHISLLEPLLKEYDVAVPQKDWKSLVIVPKTIEESYAVGVDAEKKNIAMYEKFLKENLPAEVKEVFEELKNGSEKHLAAFQRQVDKASGNEIQNGKGQGNKVQKNDCTIGEKGKQIGQEGQQTGQGNKQGNRQGNRQENKKASSEDCTNN